MRQDTNNPSIPKLQEDHLRLKGEQRDADFQELMKLPAFRRYVWALLEDCLVFHPVTVDSPYWTAFNDGNRNAGLSILDDIKRVAPKYLGEMFAESAEKERQMKLLMATISKGGNKQ